MSAATLAERTAAKARGNEPAVAEQETIPVPTAAELIAQSEPEPEPDDELREGEYPQYADVPVHIAWLRVRHDIKAISKREKFIEGKGQNATVKYNFRGADTVVNAYSPVTLRHGVNVRSIKVVDTHRDIFSKAGNRMSECVVRVTWEITGPNGDTMRAQTVGEAIDTSDKASTKAQTVALRTLLLGGGLIPTGDADPDSQYIERGDDSVPQANAYLAEITDPSTSRERFRQIYHELDTHRLVPRIVEHQGQRTSLGALYMRISNERWPKQKPAEPQHKDHPDGVWTDGCEGCAGESHAIEQRDAGGES